MPGAEAADGPVPLARPTATVFASIAAGQLLNFLSLSLFSAWLGLDGFGRYGICLLDFTVFSNLANFALPAASIVLAVRGRFRDGAFALAMGTRWWTSLTALAGYLAFEAVFRKGELAITALALAPAVIFNPAQVEWWFVARRSWKDLVIHRCLGGAVTLAITLTIVRSWPSLVSAAAAFSSGAAASTVYLILRAASGGRGLRLPWPRPGGRRMRWLWAKSLPVALTGAGDFLFLPLGYYGFRLAVGEGAQLGAYGAAFRILAAASLFSSSLFLVLLPHFSAEKRHGPGSGAEASLARVFDVSALSLAAFLLAVPFLARPLLGMVFPKAGWDPASLAFASWALSAMALSTYLHLLRMPPLTRTLAAGGPWIYCRRFFLAGAANLATVGAGVLWGDARHIPILALAADFIFTGWWMADLHPRGLARWGRLGILAAWAAFYLAWVGYWA